MSRRDFEFKQGNMPNWQGRNMPPPPSFQGVDTTFSEGLPFTGPKKKIFGGSERIDLFRNSDLLGPRGDLGPREFLEVHLGFYKGVPGTLPYYLRGSCRDLVCP